MTLKAKTWTRRTLRPNLGQSLMGLADLLVGSFGRVLRDLNNLPRLPRLVL